MERELTVKRARAGQETARQRGRTVETQTQHHGQQVGDSKCSSPLQRPSLRGGRLDDARHLSYDALPMGPCDRSEVATDGPSAPALYRLLASSDNDLGGDTKTNNDRGVRKAPARSGNDVA
jgi:hypothetical protein